MFGTRLAEIRKLKNISQYELAKRLSLTRGQIANYEQGKREPDFETLEKFANFFDVSVDYLLGRLDSSRALYDLEKVTETRVNYQTKEIGRRLRNHTDPNTGLTEVQMKVLQHMREHPKFNEFFHDLASSPEYKIDQLIKLWEIVKVNIPEDASEDPLK